MMEEALWDMLLPKMTKPEKRKVHSLLVDHMGKKSEDQKIITRRQTNVYNL